MEGVNRRKDDISVDSHYSGSHGASQYTSKYCYFYIPPTARVIKLTEDMLSGGRHFTKEETEWTGQEAKGQVDNKSNEKGATDGKMSE